MQCKAKQCNAKQSSAKQSKEKKSKSMQSNAKHHHHHHDHLHHHPHTHTHILHKLFSIVCFLCAPMTWIASSWHVSCFRCRGWPKERNPLVSPNSDFSELDSFSFTRFRIDFTAFNSKCFDFAGFDSNFFDFAISARILLKNVDFGNGC